jgi:hypothetical protein
MIKRRLVTRHVRNGLGVATLSLTCLACQAATAIAGGATSIALAPTLTTNTLLSANLATEPTQHQGYYSQCQWWLVPLMAHDEAEITGSTAFGTTLYPPGTSDSNFTAAQGYIPGLLNTGIRVSATSAGSYPLSICGNQLGGGAVIGQEGVGPFTFEVAVQHSAILYVEAKIRTKLAGTLPVYVRDIEGTPISSAALTVSLYGRWKDAGPVPATNHLIATAYPVAGIAHVKFRLPRRFSHRTVTLVVSGSGKTFQTLASHNVVDRVT